MARQLRLETPGAHYHVLNRGVERRVIFPEPGDARAFLGLMEELSLRFEVRVFPYCLMPNHYQCWHRQAFNRRWRRVGPMCQCTKGAGATV